MTERKLTDSQQEACESLLDLLAEADGECDRCDYCNCLLIGVTFTTPERIVTHSHCLNCGAHAIGVEGDLSA